MKTELRDPSWNHEKADLIIVRHAIVGCIHQKKVTVVPDDIDVFALSLHFYASGNCKSTLRELYKGRQAQ